MLSIVFFFKGGYLIDLDISGEFVSSYHVFFGTDSPLGDCDNHAQLG